MFAKNIFQKEIQNSIRILSHGDNQRSEQKESYCFAFEKRNCFKKFSKSIWANEDLILSKINYSIFAIVGLIYRKTSNKLFPEFSDLFGTISYIWVRKDCVCSFHVKIIDQTGQRDSDSSSTLFDLQTGNLWNYC